MKLNVKVTNPELLQIISMIREDGKDVVKEHQEAFANTLMHTTLVAPAHVDEANLEEVDGELKVKADNNIQFPVIHAGENKTGFVIFTDNEAVEEFIASRPELKDKWNVNVALTFEEVARLLMMKDKDGKLSPTSDVFLNPGRENLVVPKQLMTRVLIKQQSASAIGSLYGDIQFNEVVSNPMLVGAIQLLRSDGANRQTEHLKMLTESLREAKLMTPVLIYPRPQIAEDGKVMPQSVTKLMFPIFITKDVRKYFMVFSDKHSLDKAIEKEMEKDPESKTFEFTMPAKMDYMAGMVMASRTENVDIDRQADGIILNPFVDDIIIENKALIPFLKTVDERGPKAAAEAPSAEDKTEE